jgi:hypothetical protein
MSEEANLLLLLARGGAASVSEQRQTIIPMSELFNASSFALPPQMSILAPPQMPLLALPRISIIAPPQFLLIAPPQPNGPPNPPSAPPPTDNQSPTKAITEAPKKKRRRKGGTSFKNKPKGKMLGKNVYQKKERTSSSHQCPAAKVGHPTQMQTRNCTLAIPPIASKESLLPNLYSLKHKVSKQSIIC